MIAARPIRAWRTLLEPPPDDPHQSESALIDTLLRATEPRGALTVGPGDDAAVLADGTVITADTLVEGVHFADRLSPEDVGFKAVAVSVSDLAAMGARPAWMVLSLSTPERDAWCDAFAVGLGEAARSWGVDLVGGDVTSSPGPRVVSITMGGRCVAAPILRSGGRSGDGIWVSGTPGLAGCGWMHSDPPEAALAALRRPQPPLELALELARDGLVTAMMDLSDGLASDLRRLCAASGCGAVVDAAALPVHPALAELPQHLLYQVAAGEDYELLLCAPAEVDLSGRGLTRIGTLTPGAGVELRGASWPAVPFTHFEASS